MNKIKTYLDFARPFTLLPPALGVVSGAVTAWGSHGTRERGDARDRAARRSGARLMAAVLNAASNAINQIYDLEIDRVNKPKRPLPAGTLTMGEAWGFTLGCFVLAWLLAWLAAPPALRGAAASASGSCSSRASWSGPTRRRRCAPSATASGRT